MDSERRSTPSQLPTRAEALRRGAPMPAVTPVARMLPNPSIRGFTPGTVLAGRYRVIGLLGRGGMGEVYRADDLKLHTGRAEIPAARRRRRSASATLSVARFASRGRSRTPTFAASTTSARPADGGHFPVDGVRRRRGSRVAAAAHRTPAGGQGARVRASALRRSGLPRTTAESCTATSSRRT